MELFIVRHGESTNNRGEGPRVPDPFLTERGEEQARRTGVKLRELGIDHLYCSPMRRTLQTAGLILESLDVTPHVYVALHEWGGVWEAGEEESEQIIHRPGLTRDEMLEIHGLFNIPEEITAQGWWTRRWETVEESIRLSHDNAAAFVEHIRNHHAEGDRIAAVMHGGSGSTLIASIFGLPALPVERAYQRFRHNNTGISKIRFHSEGPQVLWLNRIDHLPEEVVS